MIGESTARIGVRLLYRVAGYVAAYRFALVCCEWLGAEHPVTLAAMGEMLFLLRRDSKR